MYHIYHDIEIHCLQETLFDAVTLPAHLDRWWTVRSEGRPETDAVYSFYFSDDYDWRAKVMECHRPDSITYLMTAADKDWMNTLLSFEIRSLNRQTQVLRFEHRNWSSTNDHFRKTSYCWALYLNDMKKFLEKEFSEVQQSHS